MHTRGYDSLSIFLVGGSGKVQFKVSVVEFLINFAIQRDIRFLVDVCMKDVLVDTIQVIQEGHQLVWSMKPNDSVMNIDQQRGVTQSTAIFSVFYDNVHNHWK